MEFILNVIPNQQAIHFVDQTMANYTELYNLPHKKELCFVTHELVINAVEAMQNAHKHETTTIQIHVSQINNKIQITVTDQAEGIPKKDWEKVLQFDLEAITFSDRGRGLFFVKNMVDEIWFENISDSKFLVGVSKIVNR